LPELRLPFACSLLYDQRMADPRTYRLRPGEDLEVERGSSIMCCAGVVEVGDRVLRAGESLALESGARVTALEGMRDEWLGDSGIAVVYLCDARAVAPPSERSAPRWSSGWPDCRKYPRT
jgi:hypothetical protein